MNKNIIILVALGAALACLVFFYVLPQYRKMNPKPVPGQSGMMPGGGMPGMVPPGGMPPAEEE